MTIALDEIGRLPMPGDNVAIASRRLEAGTVVDCCGRQFALSHAILEGHRFAVATISERAFLLSWELPFGTALRRIEPGEYVCNSKILQALRQRHVNFALPEQPNFENYLAPYEFNEAQFFAGSQVPRHSELRFFEGFARSQRRGAGTRNHIVVLGTSSWTGSFARALADRFGGITAKYPNIDGVVAVAHTEGGGTSRPNNSDVVLRTLAGFMTHPNVGAVLAVDSGNEPINNRVLEEFLRDNQYPIAEVQHQFLSMRGHYLGTLAEGERIVTSWLPEVNRCQRSQQSIEHLRVALQCGGSDAFSGVSGNPLAGWVAKEIIRYGGAANLAETDELIGAERYVLSNVRDLHTARRFVETLARFQERAGWHGHDAEGNPSGGNNFRGLYNIAIKSIGAARKKDPDVRLDYVIDYSELMRAPGFYFMDSPGNDLESIAGQIASGCNLILFTTGNGSVTNFPFVPTIKIMTSTGRFRMLTHEMDVNAGAYQDGRPMDVLGSETFELALRIASGERSAGEKAGHSQVQIWREWRQTNRNQLDAIRKTPQPAGAPLRLAPDNACGSPSPLLSGARPSSAAAMSTRSGPLTSSNAECAFPVSAPEDGRTPVTFRALRTSRGVASDQVGLIVPTSLCSGQIGRLIVDKLNRQSHGIRFVALPHTEGCGNSAGDSEELFLRTMAGYLSHPFVRSGILLEHGCEKTHNDAMRNFLTEQGLDCSRFGWASVQLDGGIEKVTAKVSEWFVRDLADIAPLETIQVGLEAARIAVTGIGRVPSAVAAGFALLVRQIVSAGGTVVVPHNASLLEEKAFIEPIFAMAQVEPTLAYGQPFKKPGLHIMQTPTDHQVETFTGLGATGIELVLAHVTDRVLQGHPLVPLAQVTSADEPNGATNSLDADLVLDALEKEAAEQLLQLATRILSREYKPKALATGNTDFQMTRGLLGISL